MTTTKHDIAVQMGERLEQDPKVMLPVVERILKELTEGLASGGHWEIRNFGVFKIKQRAPRLGRNIHTCESVPVPSRHDVVFKAGRNVLAMVDRAPQITRPKKRRP